MGIENLIEFLKDDKDTLKNVAKVYEEDYLRDAFKIYEALDDKENMQKIAKEHFIKSSYDSDSLLKESGLKATADLYSEKGDNLIKRAENYNNIELSIIKINNYESAIECYLKANDDLKIKETISKIKQTANNYVKGK